MQNTAKQNYPAFHNTQPGYKVSLFYSALKPPGGVSTSYIVRCWRSRPTFSKLLGKILGRFLTLGQSLTISGKTLTRHNFTLLTNSRFNNNDQHNAKIKVIIKIIIALLFPNLRLMLCSIFSYDFLKIRNLPKKF